MGARGQLYKETVNVTRSSPQLVFIFNIIIIFGHVSTAAVVKRLF